jgi:hypothetical protein
MPIRFPQIIDEFWKPSILCIALFFLQEFYSIALKKADAKKQKVILRIIKRMVKSSLYSLSEILHYFLFLVQISTEKSHAETLKLQGGELVTTIKTLVQSAR